MNQQTVTLPIEYNHATDDVIWEDRRYRLSRSRFTQTNPPQSLCRSFRDRHHHARILDRQISAEPPRNLNRLEAITGLDFASCRLAIPRGRSLHLSLPTDTKKVQNRTLTEQVKPDPFDN